MRGRPHDDRRDQHPAGDNAGDGGGRGEAPEGLRPLPGAPPIASPRPCPLWRAPGLRVTYDGRRLRASQVDGPRVPPGLQDKGEPLVKGDSKSYIIGAASIIAKARGH